MEPEPTTCGHCDYEESNGELIEQCDLCKAIDATAEMVNARTTALDGTIVACRKLEKRLLQALDGEALRGLKLLKPEFYGARVRGKDVDAKLNSRRDGNGALCLNQFGRLVVTGPTFHRPADAADFRAGDVEHLAKTLNFVLKRHRRSVANATEQYRRLGRLAEAITHALAVSEQVCPTHNHPLGADGTCHDCVVDAST